jgi:hypothetical protein
MKAAIPIDLQLQLRQSATLRRARGDDIAGLDCAMGQLACSSAIDILFVLYIAYKSFMRRRNYREQVALKGNTRRLIVHDKAERPLRDF